ncbi:MAG: hypothetical protein J0G37_18125 [Afipia sp.]|nr:hypothetical protein [Afipia sp.]
MGGLSLQWRGAELRHRVQGRDLGHAIIEQGRANHDQEQENACDAEVFRIVFVMVMKLEPHDPHSGGKLYGNKQRQRDRVPSARNDFDDALQGVRCSVDSQYVLRFDETQ